QSPDLETRLAILYRKALEQQTELPPDVARLLADRIQDNVRDLEGSLNRIIAFARLTASPISLPIANQALSALTPPATDSPPGAEVILQTVSTYFNIPQQSLRGKSRAQPISTARHIAMFLLREDADQSLKEIGHILGDRDHSTIIHGYQKVTALLKNDPRLRLHISEIRALLRG
ncbi:MAG: helix-turn-helix domain-containing protein, partial [Nitrospiria bacterium]